MRAHPNSLSEPTDKPSGNECVDVETLVLTYEVGVGMRVLDMRWDVNDINRMTTRFPNVNWEQRLNRESDIRYITFITIQLTWYVSDIQMEVKGQYHGNSSPQRTGII